MKNSYRDEIDVFRSIAVIAVIIFHYFPNLLPGGYLGVDLFFVISGYVISLQIYEYYLNKNFKFKNFYYRRIKRIFPATFFLLLVCSLISYYLLTLSDLISFAKSVFFSISFTSNIYFWLTGGYFFPNDELKPLLHLWSLSVEEQFYIFFPFLFIILLKFIKNKKLFFIIIFFICLLSFYLNSFVIKIGGSNPAFFLLPTRIWNFCFGVLAMFYFVNFNKRKHRNFELIFFSVLLLIEFFIEITFLPNGTILILSSAYLLSKKFEGNSVLSKIYFNKFLKKIGLISFSLYLWHWPLLVYFKYYYIDGVPILIKFLSILLMILFAIVSYIFIEKKFRYDFSKHQVLSKLSFVIIILLTLNIFYLNKPIKSLENKYASDKISMSIQSNYRCNPLDFEIRKNLKICNLIKSKNIYDVGLVGNSHAQMYSPSIIKHLVDTNRSGILIAMTGCLPTIDYNINAGCLDQAKLNFNVYANDKNLETIIIGTTWSYKKLFDGDKFIDDNEYLVYGTSLLNLVEKIERNNKKVYLIGPIQTPSYQLASILSRKIKFEKLNQSQVFEELAIDRSIFDKNFYKVRELLKSKMGKFFIDPSLIQCDTKYCYLGNDNGIFFADLDHLGSYGSEYFSDIFREVFN